MLGIYRLTSQTLKLFAKTVAESIGLTYQQAGKQASLSEAGDSTIYSLLKDCKDFSNLKKQSNKQSQSGLHNDETALNDISNIVHLKPPHSYQADARL